jgi:hypothetical protein
LKQAGLAPNAIPFQCEIDELFASVAADDARTIRPRSVALAQRAEDICSDLSVLAACVAARGVVEPAIEGLMNLAKTVLNSCGAGVSSPRVAVATEAAKVALGELYAESADTCEDPCRQAFGVSRDDVSDANGIFSSSRLYGHYYGRYGELLARVYNVWSSFAETPPILENALTPAWTLVNAEQPLTMLRAAVFAREQVQSAFAAKPDDSGKILRAYKLRVDRSRANHAGAVRIQKALRSSETRSETAELTLDLYRRMVEGQFRPWAWTLLQLRGRAGSKLPELSSLRDQLVADGNRVLADAARVILTAARNAAAHEDFEWDEEIEKIRVGDATTSVAELEEAITQAYEFMCGCECAIVDCRASDRALFAAMNSEDPPHGFLARNLAVAVDLFGTNGLKVKTHAMDRGTFSVHLEDWPLKSVNPGLQALTVAAQVLPKAQRFQIRVGDSNIVAADIDRAPLQENWRVWMKARDRFSEMPLSAFLPANAAVRLAVEQPVQASRAITWMALNDVLHALADVAEKRNDRRGARRQWPQMQAHIELAHLALGLANEIIGETADDAKSAQEVLRKIAREIAKPKRQLVHVFMDGLVRDLQKRWGELGPVSILPTLDPAPLD